MSGPRRPDSSEPDTVPLRVPRRPPVRNPTLPWYLAERPRRPSPAVRPAPVPAPPPRPARPVSRARTGRLLLVGSAVTVVLAGVAAVVLAVLLVRTLGTGGAAVAVTELDVEQAQLGVQRVLTDPINGYGRADVTVVRCNNGVNPTVVAGGSFTCEVDVNGARRQVTAVFTDDTGSYEVDRPR